MKITIPPAALEAGARAISETDTGTNPYEDLARAAFTAMVEEWPGMYRADWNDKNELDPVIILPLTETSTKENDNG